jgi:hypothetical protein
MVWSACARSEPPIEVHPVDRDVVVENLGRTEGSRRVLLVSHPDRAVMDAVTTGLLPIVAVLDDPVDSVRLTRALVSCDTLHALRLQTSTACAHHLFHENPAVLLLHRGFHGNAHDVIGRVIDRLGLELSPHQLQAVLEEFGGPVEQPWSLETALATKVQHYAPLDRLGETVTAEEATLVRQVLSPMVLGAISHDIGPITWASRVFLFGDRPNEVAPAVADVTGAARIIYYGPYFHLPPGTWKVRFIVAFSAEARGTPFKLFVYCNRKPIAKVQITPSDGGAFEGTFTMQHLHPEHNVEIHFSNDEGSIEGHMALGQVTFSRLAG